jgi:type II secretory pathway component PulC
MVVFILWLCLNYDCIYIMFVFILWLCLNYGCVYIMFVFILWLYLYYGYVYTHNHNIIVNNSVYLNNRKGKAIQLQVWRDSEGSSTLSTVAYQGGFGGFNPSPTEIQKFWQSWAEFPISVENTT